MMAKSRHGSSNVLVIACNSLHLGFLGCYGNAWIETPNLDRLASEGVVFDFHFPENLTTLPTRRSWWTGRYGFPNEEAGWTPLRPEETTLPDRLWNHGVRSALISDTTYLRDPANGYSRGFDETCWIRGSGYDPFVPATSVEPVRVEAEPGLRLPDEDDPHRPIWLERWQNLLRNRAYFGHDKYEGTGVVRTARAAIEWLDRQKSGDSPFLLWLDLNSPHGPWDLPEEFRDRYAAIEPDEFELGDEGDLAETDTDEEELDLEEVTALIDVPPGPLGDVLDEAELLRLRRTYAGAVTLLDRAIGELLDYMRGSERLENTLVIFTSDQGEPLGEHGFVRRFRPWLYEELIHTPLIVRMPGGAFGGNRHQAIVQTVDLLPTALSALGLPPLEDIHGQNWLPLIRGERTKLRDYACLGMDVAEFAIRTHHWHLILPIELDPDEPRFVELYRKPEDRWEQNDVAEQHVEVAEHLELVLRRFAEAVPRGSIEELPSLRDVARFVAT